MIDSFLQVEKKAHLLDDEILGFNYWLFIRDKICDLIENIDPKNLNGSFFTKTMDKLLGTKVFGLTNSAFSLSKLCSILYNSTLNNPLLHLSHSDVLFVLSPRKVLIDGKYYSYYVDEIFDFYKNSAIVAEFLNIGDHYSKPYWNSKVIEMDFIDIFPFIFGNLNYKLKNKIRTIAVEKGEYISLLFKTEMNVDLKPEYITRLIVSRFIAWYYKKRLFKTFLDKLSPKIIIEVCYYSTNCLTLNEVARDLGICTIELQHGIMGKDHIAYNFLDNNVRLGLPDKLFVYSDYWKNTCRFPIGNNNIVSVGYPFAEMQFRKYPKRIDNDGVIRVLFLSQPVFHKDFVKAIKVCINSLQMKKVKYKLFIKPHPTEYNQSKEWWEGLNNNESVVIVGDSIMPLYKLFSISDIQVGATSTAIFEGLLYNLFTVICNFGNAIDQMHDLIMNGNAVYCDNENELGCILVNWVENRYCPKNSSTFFKKNAVKNICNELDKLLKCN